MVIIARPTRFQRAGFQLVRSHKKWGVTASLVANATKGAFTARSIAPASSDIATRTSTPAISFARFSQIAIRSISPVVKSINSCQRFGAEALPNLPSGRRLYTACALSM